MQTGWIWRSAEHDEPFTQPAQDDQRTGPSSGYQRNDDEGENEAQQGKALTQARAVLIFWRRSVVHRGGIASLVTGAGVDRIMLGVGILVSDKSDDAGHVPGRVVLAVGAESMHHEQAGQDREEQERDPQYAGVGGACVFPSHVT